MDITKEKRINSSREYKINIENVSICVLTDYANDFELPARYKRGTAYPHYKIIAVSEGSIELHFDYSFYTLKKNDVAIVAPGNRYDINKIGECVKFYNIGLEFANNSLKGSLNYFKCLSNIFKDDNCMWKDNEKLVKSVKNCFESVVADKTETVGINIYAMINELINVVGANPLPVYKEHKNGMSRMHKINLLVHSFYDEDISVDEVAKILNLSQSQTIRVIRKYFGMTWTELIIKKRMEVALWQVANNVSASIAEIASMVGYETERGFYGTFKKYFGNAPSFYRGKHDLVNDILLAQKTNINRHEIATQNERK